MPLFLPEMQSYFANFSPRLLIHQLTNSPIYQLTNFTRYALFLFTICYLILSSDFCFLTSVFCLLSSSFLTIPDTILVFYPGHHTAQFFPYFFNKKISFFITHRFKVRSTNLILNKPIFSKLSVLDFI